MRYAAGVRMDGAAGVVGLADVPGVQDALEEVVEMALGGVFLGEHPPGTRASPLAPGREGRSPGSRRGSRVRITACSLGGLAGGRGEIGIHPRPAAGRLSGGRRQESASVVAAAV